jgi:hypothetical protein
MELQNKHIDLNPLELLEFFPKKLDITDKIYLELDCFKKHYTKFEDSRFLMFYLSGDYTGSFIIHLDSTDETIHDIAPELLNIIIGQAITYFDNTNHSLSIISEPKFISKESYDKNFDLQNRKIKELVYSLNYEGIISKVSVQLTCELSNSSRTA